MNLCASCILDLGLFDRQHAPGNPSGRRSAENPLGSLGPGTEMDE